MAKLCVCKLLQGVLAQNLLLTSERERLASLLGGLVSSGGCEVRIVFMW